MDVVGLGALNLDLLYETDVSLAEYSTGGERAGDLEELERVRDTLRRHGRLRGRSGGGSAANTVYALAQLGFRCGMLGKAGRDDNGTALVEELRAAGVDVSHVQRGGITGFCVVVVYRGERTILVYPNSNDTLRLRPADIVYANQARLVHITSFIGEHAFRVQRNLLPRLTVPLSYDPGEPHVQRGLEDLRPFFARSWVTFPTREEVEALTGRGYREGAGVLLGCGVRIVVCTLGPEGCYVRSRKGSWTVSTQPLAVKDTTGAGDVFAAAFLGGLLRGWTLPDCARCANRAAGVSLAGYGRSHYPRGELRTACGSEQTTDTRSEA